MREKQVSEITVVLTIEHSMSDENASHELFRRHGNLRYVWNNCRTLYGPSGVKILDAREVNQERR